MADLDGILDLAEPPSDEEAGAVRGEVEHVLSPAAGELAHRAVALVEKDPEIAIPAGPAGPGEAGARQLT